MQCEGFRPGCTNAAIHFERGYNLCTPCAQEFLGYTPELSPLARARGLLYTCSISLDPLAREVLIGLVAEEFRAVEQAAYKNAARHLNQAMNDVENATVARPETPLTLCLCIDDVRRLAAELEEYL